MAALSVGVSKAGFGGVGVIQVYLMAELFGKASVGNLAADAGGGRSDGLSSLSQVWQLASGVEACCGRPLIGMTAGFFLLDWMPESFAKPLIGVIILAMAALQMVRKWKPESFKVFAESKELWRRGRGGGRLCHDGGQCGGTCVPALSDFA